MKWINPKTNGRTDEIKYSHKCSSHVPSVSDAVGNLTCSGVSWDSIQLIWELPDNPNGQVRFYEVQLEVEGQSYLHKADTAEYTVSGLSPDQVYTVTVAAVNSAGPGDLANCTASTLSESGRLVSIDLLLKCSNAEELLTSALCVSSNSPSGTALAHHHSYRH